MNGENKDEAHRPRPLSAGIWTLFSWFRRSERSSSSESLSSVGSARTAVSFDFLAPGNCNINNTPILFTTPLNPPSETYRKRLQERNLRRQRDRDITLHRKYGLFRENGKEFEGFSLPPVSRTLGNTCDKASRERRATSECLQRRAAYVPGKRRAPQPPVTATSVSLPRAYKRKRPAPKPPTKNTLNDNISTVKFMNDPVRMNLNSGPEENNFPDYEILSSSSKTEKCDKEVIHTRVTKSRADKNFLKHIFDNRKRNSASEATSVKLLPSISELDKQAAEIIENKKLRQNINNFTPKSLNNSQFKTTYEGNSWFCISCLRKYNSSVNSCSYCLPDKNPYKRHSANLCPKSIYTQTNNVETAGSSKKNKDEREMLKDILKEMKDSLPKSPMTNNYNKVNDVMTETPTLRIGSTLKEKNNDLTSQPSTSRSSWQIEKKSVSSSVSQIQRNDRKNHISDQSVKDIINSSELSKVNLILENKSYASTSTYDRHPVVSLSDKELKKEINITKTTEHSIANVHLKESDNLINKSNTKNQTTSPLTNKTDGKEIGKIVSMVPQGIASNILNRNENFPTDRIPLNSDDRNKTLLSSSAISSKIENVPQMSSKLQFLNFTASREVNSVTKAQSSKAETSNKNSGSNCAEQKIQTETKKEIKSLLQSNAYPDNVNKIINETYLESDLKTTKISNAIKPDSSLHTPLKISSLLNPLCSLKSNKSLEPDGDKELIKEVKQTLKTNINSKEFEKTALLNINGINPITSQDIQLKKKLETKETANQKSKQPLNINTTLKDVSHEHKAIPYLSGFSCNETANSSNNVDKLNILDKRRHFINQLEQSIAKGDEIAAAEAAVKLAKLRLSCSVLSFSSQIVGESSNNKRQVFGTDTAPPFSNEKLIVDAPLDTVKSEPDNLVEINTEISTKVESNVKKSTFACEPSSSSSFSVKSDDTVPINIWIEDKQAARGPICLRISRKATMADIKRQTEQSLGLAIQLQRWIVGRALCTDDEATVISLAGLDFRAPFYLCIVQSDQNKKSVEINEDEVASKDIDKKNDCTTHKSGEFYSELMKLEKQSLVPNIETFECGVCMEECAAGAGVVLRECIHTFCRDCLSDMVQHCQEPEVACPAVGCTGVLQEREIRTIVSSEEYEKWLARGLATAECGTRNAFHCRTRDCSGWAFCDPGVTRFPCPVCNKINCVQCQAIHEGETCAQYQKKLREAVAAAETNKDDEGTRAFLNSLISRGEALECPECKTIITKKWGCDWVKCSACKTEICWVTKGKRWGPGGRGDTSGGCRCGIDGQRCHPSCGYCH